MSSGCYSGPMAPIRWVMQTVAPVSLRGKELLVESFVDITERRQWEEAIQTTNDKLHTLVAQVEERNRTMTLANEMARYAASLPGFGRSL